MKLKDCVAIVTGGGGGIGRAIAIKFSEQGSKLVIVDRKVDLADETVSIIKKLETEAIGIKTDVTNFTQVQ
jgi:NAD(P)-dependent dehydrogenase (short-subunit alcohol dehydrogenase family)